MNKKRVSSQLSPIEIFKDILIVLLLCSACFLLWEAQLLVGILSPLSTDETALSTEVQVYQIQAEAARPVRMAAILATDTLYGVQYDDDGVDALFQQSSNLLREALGSLDEPLTITEVQWQEMLSSAPGLYFEMLGNVPLSVLSGWLSGVEDDSLDVAPSRLLLTTLEGTVALCYQLADGSFFCATTQVVDAERLQAVVDQHTSNGAKFAYQMESDYDNIDPYTLLSNTAISPTVYLSENPISTTDSREDLLAILGLDDHLSSTYATTDGLGIVIRSDGDTLRIYGSGIVTYESEVGLSSYAVTSSSATPTIFDVVESCRSLATTAIIPFCGDARIHLLSVEEGENGWTVTFGYSLDGSPIQFSDGTEAAQFVVEGNEILSFTLRLRQYTATDETSTPLPQLQAAAAMAPLCYHGQRLVLSYYDGGASPIYADWSGGNG